MLDNIENKVILGDALDVLPTIPDDSVDMIVTDPPYKIQKRGQTGLHGMMNTKDSLQGKVFTHNDIDISEYIGDFYRILKESGHCYIMSNGFNFLHFIDVIRQSKFNFCKLLIWDKQNVIANTMYMSSFEYIFFLYKGRAKVINNCGTPDILRFKNVKPKDKHGNNLHDSAKPVPLFQCMIENSTKQGELVLDPFSGIGTCALAAIRSGRKYLCMEKDEKYYDIINKRIKNENSQLSLF